MSQDDESLFLLSHNGKQLSGLNDVHQVVAELELHLHAGDPRLILLGGGMARQHKKSDNGEKPSIHRKISGDVHMDESNLPPAKQTAFLGFSRLTRPGRMPSAQPLPIYLI